LPDYCQHTDTNAPNRAEREREREGEYHQQKWDEMEAWEQLGAAGQLHYSFVCHQYVNLFLTWCAACYESYSNLRMEGTKWSLPLYSTTIHSKGPVYMFISCNIDVVDAKQIEMLQKQSDGLLN
jgi:hypothetical protein